MQESRVHIPRALPSRFVPPSGFGYPLGGLLLAMPRRFCFTPAALMGFTLRSFSSRKVSGPFPAGSTHVPFSQVGIPAPEGAGRLDRARFLGFAPSGSPKSHEHVFSTPATGCSLGFRPSRACHVRLDGNFAPSPLTRFSATALHRSDGAPEYRSASAPPRPPCGKPQGTAGTTLLGFSHRPASRTFKRAPTRVMWSPHTASHVTADCPAILGWFTALPELSGPAEVPSICAQSLKERFRFSLTY
jgi:hypothetical protein